MKAHRDYRSNDASSSMHSHDVKKSQSLYNFDCKNLTSCRQKITKLPTC